VSIDAVRAFAAASRAPLPEKMRLPTVMLNSADSLPFLVAISASISAR
jgi:hypothetical protein